ncbi:putative PIG3 family NAD(P)H quinone oxidoreductase [Hoeflea marina]|uniref:Putative PIG3 family NAD(P)H quinone oxidoreductase n=1 Tax=Hoeflea marina TaxID=274592 RepID=A0A317PEU8_9HYPH|nr:NAD(P)H-quinone oxidoreductase [Hoeflea marina]PWV97264.1 putative PIG3 family NAD(P)H quinone oxidoreductase [Hoeflea marina]
MRAIEIREPGGPEVLAVVDRPMPEAKPGDLLVRVRAAGVNRPDCLQRQGFYPPPPGASDIPGLEIAGEVVGLGSRVSGFSIGDLVCGLVPGGGYAEYCVLDQGSALPVPGGLTMNEAAAVPETFFTVWHNVFQRGGLKSGESFLVHGGTSGIGTTAIQLAKSFGARVLATAGSDAKCEAMRALGADVVINYRDQDFVAAVGDATDGAGVNLILDMVGGDYVNRNYQAASIDGRIVQIAFLTGRKTEVDLSLLMTKRLTHTGSTLRARSPDFKAGIAAELRSRVWPLFKDRKILPVMDSIYSLDQGPAAHSRIEDGAHIGKIVIEVG